jgi:serine/threonine protein kinase
VSGSGNIDSNDLGIPGLADFSPIGQGGFGSVYRAKQISFDRLVAVKVLAASGLNDGIERRFERECRAIGSLSGHPHILTVHDSGVTRWGRPYILMDYMVGGSLADRLQREGPLQWEEAVEIGIKVAGAVAAAHSAGIIHRDIKPQNVLVSSYGEPKLGDFGISTIPTGYQTHSGVITTSLAYAPPEVLNGEAATEASDLYSLAATIFSFIKGSPPFVETGTEPIAALITGSLTKPVPDLRAKAPASVCEVLERAMSKDGGERHGSAAEFGEALRSAQAREGVAMTPLVSAQVPYAPTLPAAMAPATRPVDATISSNRKNLFEEKPAPVEEPPRRSRSRVAALIAGGVLVLATSGMALALRDTSEPTAAVAVDPAPTLTPTPTPTPTPALTAKVKTFTIAHAASTGTFTGRLVSSTRSCDSNRGIELWKRDRERPFQIVRSSGSGRWRVRMPNASGVFYAKALSTKRSGGLRCQAGRTRALFVKAEPEANAPAAPPPPPAPAPQDSPAPAPAPAPAPDGGSQPPPDDSNSGPPQDPDQCPPGYHEESDGRCYPD